MGKVEPVQKIWFTKKELCSYLGVTERFVERIINPMPGVEIFQPSGRTYLYNKENIDRMIRRSKVV